MLKISYASCLGLSPAISAQFTLEMRVAAQNREKFTETPYFRGSRSFKAIDVYISERLITSACYISSMSVHICNHFYTRKQLLLSAHLSHRSSVCLSVCLSVYLSRGWISQKRCKLGSPNFHRRLPERL